MTREHKIRILISRFKTPAERLQAAEELLKHPQWINKRLAIWLGIKYKNSHKAR